MFNKKNAVKGALIGTGVSASTLGIKGLITWSSPITIPAAMIVSTAAVIGAGIGGFITGFIEGFQEGLNKPETSIPEQPSFIDVSTMETQMNC